jgi:SRSO17 transposase
MVAACAALRVVAVREALPGPAVWWVRRRHRETGEWKTSLSHAPIDTAWESHVRMRGMRGPIATCFEDGQPLLGMGDGEVRSGTGWPHHRTLVMLAHFFGVRLSWR